MRELLHCINHTEIMRVKGGGMAGVGIGIKSVKIKTDG